MAYITAHLKKPETLMEPAQNVDYQNVRSSAGSFLLRVA
jgi:hypothetical protein